VYRLRVLGLGVGFFAVGGVLYEEGASWATWALLFLHTYIWPHVAWWRARTSDDPHAIERQNLVLDSTLGGVFIALMHFNLLPTVLLATMLSMDKVGWGPTFLAKTVASMAGACLLTMAVVGVHVDARTSMREIEASLPLMVAYPLAVAFTSYRSGKLTRERNKAIQQTAELREQLAHIARVGTLGEMAAGLAHELNQPLAAIHLEANAALELGSAETFDDMRNALSAIANQSIRAGDIVRRMRSFARRNDTKREPLDMHLLIREVLALVAHDLRMHGVTVSEPNGTPLPRVHVNRIEIQQVLVNLIRNAIDAMSEPNIASRRLTIRTEVVEGRVRVSVVDSGPGVSAEVAGKLFHPFQTTKPSGMGLGLSICQSLVEANGGRIGHTPQHDGGAIFFFELPAVASA